MFTANGCPSTSSVVHTEPHRISIGPKSSTGFRKVYSGKSDQKRPNQVHLVGLGKLALLFSLIISTGCTVSRPLWLGDAGISEMCKESGAFEFAHNGVTRQFFVNLVEDGEILKHCGHDRYGQPPVACIVNGYDIYVTPGNSCTKHMAHELNHGFGLHYVDRPRVYGDDHHG